MSIVDQPAPKPGKERDMLADAYAAARDLACYLRGAIEERPKEGQACPTCNSDIITVRCREARRDMLQEVLRRTNRGLDFRGGKQVRAEVKAMLRELGDVE